MTGLSGPWSPKQIGRRMAYRENQPKYDAVQWDGTNQTEVAEFIGAIDYANVDPQLASINDQEGWLVFGYDPARGNGPAIPPGMWLVAGPYWGDTPISGSLTMHTAEQFAARFSEVA